MKIYSMTATFGKLEHETLTLKPGLNIIEAPNEWGKSTWCAFLVNMLYGVETRAKSTKAALADKDRYAPWSGSPMSGRIDLNWNGRDITLERSTRGRLILGDFRAYETATGTDIPELNAGNCGAMLLGVERSVFTRAGFVRLTDLPVTQDEALRRRLNSLVTTGDESGAGDKLQKTLKDLKNKCRYNRSGLLPQAEAQREQLEGQLSELQQLADQSNKLLARQSDLESWTAQLENHQAALRYAASAEDARRVNDALAEKEAAQAVFDGLTQSCDGLPSRNAAQQALQEAQSLQQQRAALQLEGQMLPDTPAEPEIPEHYRETAPEEAVHHAKADIQALTALEKKRRGCRNAMVICCTVFLLCVILALVARYVFQNVNSGLYLAVAGILIIISNLVFALYGKGLLTRSRAISDRHPGLSPDRWVTDAEEYARRRQKYAAEIAQYQTIRGDFDARRDALDERIRRFTGGESLDAALEQWNQILASWDALGDARRSLLQAENHAAALQAMAKPAQPPQYPDSLTHSPEETDALLSSARFELRQLQLKLGQYQGRAEALGQESVLRTQLKAVNRRIHKLEDTYAALELAQKALAAATTELQRRFAPRISRRAQALFGKLTGGRYDRLTLSEDLSLNTCTTQEDTLRASQWRSDGTIDQLYLALRLAVAEELTPDAPLLLDDALVRFDDRRLAAAIDILREMAQTKQVILFTCQSRESTLQGECS